MTKEKMFFHPTINNIYYAMFQHVNKVGLVVHGCVKGGLQSFFLGMYENTQKLLCWNILDWDFPFIKRWISTKFK
jgi:hypothetical protein